MAIAISLASVSTISNTKQQKLKDVEMYFWGGLKLYMHIHHKLYLIVKGYNFLVVR